MRSVARPGKHNADQYVTGHSRIWVPYHISTREIGWFVAVCKPREQMSIDVVITALMIKLTIRGVVGGLGSRHKKLVIGFDVIDWSVCAVVQTEG
jgi:hypothetical protein